MRNAFNDNGLVDDGLFDWCVLKEGKQFSSGTSSIQVKIEKRVEGGREDNTENLLDD